MKYPYLLPCALAASITFTGKCPFSNIEYVSLNITNRVDRVAIPGSRRRPEREGAIRLVPDKLENEHPDIPEEPSSPLVDEPEPRSVVGSIGRKVSQRLSGYFIQRVHDSHAVSPPQAVPLSSSAPRSRPFSRISRADGSAYGYSGNSRRRLASNATLGVRRGSNASSMRRRRGSNLDGPQSLVDTRDLNFAQRLLMANENAVTNIADLWVAAAMNVDNENPFESDSDMGSPTESDNDESGDDDFPPTPTRAGRLSGRLASNPPRQSLYNGPLGASSASPRRPSTSHMPSTPSIRQMSSYMTGLDGSPSPRRFSNAVPAIFSHAGVRTPPAVLDAQQMLLRSEEPVGGDSLAPIIERRHTSDSHSTSASSETILEKPPTLASQIPVLVIVQYGLLALHSTTHDQVFLSYLVS